MSPIRITALSLTLAAIAITSAGCASMRLPVPLFLKRNTEEAAAPEKPANPRKIRQLAADTDAIFQREWVAQRVIELTAQGVAEAAARERALAEFSQRFPYTRPVAAN